MRLLDRLPWSAAARRRRRLTRIAQERPGVRMDALGHPVYPPPFMGDPSIVGNAEGNRRLREQDRAALRARLDDERARRHYWPNQPEWGSTGISRYLRSSRPRRIEGKERDR